MGFLSPIDVPASDWLNVGLCFVGIVLFIAAAELARSRIGWPTEINRKLVHVATGILIFFTPMFFQTAAPLVVMALLFILVNAVGIKTGKLKGMHDTRRTSYGTVFYPVTFLILVLTCWENHKTVLQLSVLILAVSDAMAALVGENLRSPHEYRLGADKKSLEGSATMFISGFLMVWLLLPYLVVQDGRIVSGPQALWIAFVTATVATAMEALSSKGSDNLTAPLGAAFVLGFMLTHPDADNLRLTLGMGLGLSIAVGSWAMHFLTASGSVGTFLLATLIYGVGGWEWTIPILAFFFLSSLISKFGRVHKKRFDTIFEKSSRRDIGQVLANGSVAGSIAVLHHFFPGLRLFTVYLASLAAVTADTWATEIGVFSKKQPVLVTTWKEVPIGTSGGITWLGTAGAVLGSLVLAASGWLASSPEFRNLPWWKTFGVVSASGLGGSLADSVLGALLQAQYRCPSCRKITEKRVHCKGRSTRLVSGFSWMNNDRVNALCSLAGALIAGLGLTLGTP